MYGALDERVYKQGKKVNKQGKKVNEKEYARVNIHRHHVHGDWNYTIAPQEDALVVWFPCFGKRLQANTGERAQHPP